MSFVPGDDDARDRVRARVELADELFRLRHALEAAKKNAQSASFVMRLAVEIRAREKRLEWLRKNQ